MLGLGLGVLCGGRLRGLQDVELRFEWPVLALFAVQGVARGRIAGIAATPVGLTVWVLSCAALILLLAPDWRRVGIWVVLVGMALNIFVVVLNGGMPVALPGPVPSLAAATSLTSSLGFYQIAGPGTALAALGDVLELSLPRYRVLLSPGDVMMALGVAALVVDAMVNFADPTVTSPSS